MHSRGISRAIAALLSGACLYMPAAQAQSISGQGPTSPDAKSNPSAPAAQDASNPATTDAQPQTGLSDIVVTAQRRTENLQNVPIAATVLSGNELATRGVQSINGLQNVAPSIVIDTVDRSTFINIRGVGIAQISPASTSGVAYYEDGVFVPQFLIPFTFFDVGSIEVLRGPQGTLSGQSSTGGAIYMRSTAPKFDDISGYVDATIGNYNRYDLSAALNLGFNDNVAFRAAYAHLQRDSYTQNLGGPRQPGNEDINMGRVALALRSNDEKLTITVRGDVYGSHNDGVVIKNRADSNTNPYVIEQDSLTYERQNGYRISTEFRYSASDGIDLKGLVSHERGTIQDADDGDRTATGVNLFTPIQTDINTTSAELNLLSTGNGPVKWVVGGYYLKSGIPVSIYVEPGTLTGINGAAPLIAVDPESTSKALFGQINWFITTPLEVYGGFRYNWDHQDFTVTALPGVPAAAFPLFGAVSSNEPTGKIGINYHFDRNSMIYVSASKGYKQGGNNIPPGPALGYKPEINYVYEGGFKTEFLARRLRLNGDIFYSDYRDIQLQSTVGLPLTQNAANGRSYGAELEAMAQFGGFGFSGGAAYLHARFKGTACITNSNGANLGGPNCPAGNEVVPDGQVLPFAPTWTVNAEAHYDVKIGTGYTLTPRVNFSHVGAENVTAFPGYASTVPSRDLFNARLSLDSGRGWLIEGFVDNVSNKAYLSYQRQPGVGTLGGYVYGAPRTFGVRLRYDFSQK